MSDHMVEDGITETTEMALIDETIKIQSWKEIWWLLFPQDSAVLEPGKDIFHRSPLDTN